MRSREREDGRQAECEVSIERYSRECKDSGDPAECVIAILKMGGLRQVERELEQGVVVDAVGSKAKLEKLHTELGMHMNV